MKRVLIALVGFLVIPGFDVVAKQPGLQRRPSTFVARPQFDGISPRCATEYNPTPTPIVRYFDYDVTHGNSTPLTVDRNGNVYYVDMERQLQKISAEDLTISGVADLSSFFQPLVAEGATGMRWIEPVSLVRGRDEFYFFSNLNDNVYRFGDDGNSSAILTLSPWNYSSLSIDRNRYLWFLSNYEIRRVDADIRNIEEPLDSSNTVLVASSEVNGQTTMKVWRGDLFYTAASDGGRGGYRRVIRKKTVSGEDNVIVEFFHLDDLAFNKCGHLYFSANNSSGDEGIYRFSSSSGEVTPVLLNVDYARSAPVYFVFDRNDNVYAIMCESSTDIVGRGPCNIVKFSPVN